MLLPRSCAWTTALTHSIHSSWKHHSRTGTASAAMAQVCRSPVTPAATTTRSAAAQYHRRQYTSEPAPAPPPETVVEASDQDQATSEKFRRVLRKVPFPVVVISTCSPEDSTLRRGITISSFSSISLQPVPLVSFCVKLPSRASTILHESDQFVIQFLSSDQIAHSVAFSSSIAPPPGVSKSLPTTTAANASATIGSGSGATGGGGGTRSGVPEAAAGEITNRHRSQKVPGDKDTEELVAEASRQTMIPADKPHHGTTTTTASSSATNNKPAPLSETTEEPDPFEVLGYDTDPESNLPVLRNTLGAIRCRTHQVMVVGDHEMWIGHVEKVLHGEIPDAREPLLYHDRSYRRVGRRIL